MCPRCLFRQLFIVLVSAVPAWAVTTPSLPIFLGDVRGGVCAMDRLRIDMANFGPLNLVSIDAVFNTSAAGDENAVFSCSLPTRSTVVRFSRLIEGRWVDALLLQAEQAARVYGDCSFPPARIRDGPRFVAVLRRVSEPSTRLSVSYIALSPRGRDGRREVTVPLRGLGPVRKCDIRIVCRPLPGEVPRLSEAWYGLLDENASDDCVIYENARTLRDWWGRSDLGLRYEREWGAKKPVLIRAGDLSVLTLNVPRSALNSGEPSFRSWSVFVDASASAAAFGGRRMKLIRGVMKSLARKAGAALFDVFSFSHNGPAKMFRWRGRGSLFELTEPLSSKACRGASDLELLFRNIGGLARRSRGRRAFLVITDAVATIGATTAAGLIRALGEWPDRHRLYIIVLGDAGADLARAVAAAGRGRALSIPFDRYRMIDMDIPAERLCEPGCPGVSVHNPSLDWSYPAAFVNAAQNEELLLFCKSTHVDPGRFTFKINDDDKEVGLPVVEVDAGKFGALVEAVVRRAFLEDMENDIADTARGQAYRDALKRLVGFSVVYRLLRPYTGFFLPYDERDCRYLQISRCSRAACLKPAADGVLCEAPGSVHGDVVDVQAAFSLLAERAGIDVSFGRYVYGSAVVDGRALLETSRPLDLINSLAGRHGYEVFKKPGGLLISTWSSLQQSDRRLPNSFHALGRLSPGAYFSRESFPYWIGCESEDSTRTATCCGTVPAGWKEFEAAGFADAGIFRRARDGAAASSTEGFAVLCRLYSREQQYRHLLALCRSRLAAFDPSDPTAFNYLVRSAIALGEDDLAIDTLFQTAEVDARNPFMPLWGAFLAFETRRAATAERLFHQALLRDAGNTAAYRGLSALLLSAGRYKEAAAVLEKALKFIDDGDLRTDLGRVVRAWGDRNPKMAPKVSAMARRLGAGPGDADRVTASLYPRHVRKSGIALVLKRPDGRVLTASSATGCVRTDLENGLYDLGLVCAGQWPDRMSGFVLARWGSQGILVKAFAADGRTLSSGGPLFLASFRGGG